MEPTAQHALVRRTGTAKSWAWSVCLGFIILVSGMLIGGVAGYQWGARPPGGFPPDPEKMADYIASRLRSELNLTDDQATAVHEIFVRAGRVFNEIRRKNAPEMTAAMDKVDAEVAALLTPEQLPLWKEHCARMRERSRLAPPGPPPPAPPNP